MRIWVVSVNSILCISVFQVLTIPTKAPSTLCWRIFKSQPSTLIRHENGAFQKRYSDGGNLKTPVLCFSVDGKHFENGAFRKRCDDVTIIMWFLCDNLQTQFQNDRWLQPRSQGFLSYRPLERARRDPSSHAPGAVRWETLRTRLWWLLRFQISPPYCGRGLSLREPRTKNLRGTGSN